MGNDNIPVPDLVSSESECDECECDFYERFENAIHDEMCMLDIFIPFSVCLFDHDEIRNQYELQHEIKKMTAEIHCPFVQEDDPLVVEIVDTRDEEYSHHLNVHRRNDRPISLKDVLVAMAKSVHYQDYRGDHRFLEGFDVAILQSPDGQRKQYIPSFGS
jgi:hypothetical protein